jgi:gluconolactonase
MRQNTVTPGAQVGQPGVARIFFDGLRTDPRLDHPEGIAVAADGAVWCGGEAGQIYRIQDGAIEQIATTGGFCLGVALDGDRYLYACDLIHRAVFRLDLRTAQIERFTDGAEGIPFVAPNALTVGPDGHLILTDSATPEQPAPGLFRVSPDGFCSLWSDEPLHFANGVVLSRDGRTLYVVETWARRISCFTVDEHQAIGPRRTYAELPGIVPDGLAIDAAGRLWVACYQPSQVIHVRPDGSHVVIAADPDAHLLCHPTNLAFRGDEALVPNLGRWHITAIPTAALDRAEAWA